MIEVKDLTDSQLNSWHDALMCEHIMLDDSVKAYWRILQVMTDDDQRLLKDAIDDEIEMRARAAMRVEVAHVIEQGEAREIEGLRDPLQVLQHHAARLVHYIQISAPDVIIDGVYDLVVKVYAARRQKNREANGC